MRTLAPMRPLTDAPPGRDRVPPATADRGTLVEEVLVVLSLSVLSGAAYAIVSLIEAPVSGAIVGVAGVAVYLGAVELGVNRFVIPTPPLGHWWTVPALILNALQAALVEEVIVLGYLITRLQQLSWSPLTATGA